MYLFINLIKTMKLNQNTLLIIVSLFIIVWSVRITASIYKRELDQQTWVQTLKDYRKEMIELQDTEKSDIAKEEQTRVAHENAVNKLAATTWQISELSWKIVQLETALYYVDLALTGTGWNQNNQ